ncbi:MAG: 2TM domain-containing protein [Acidimicrobiia bacterium]|nr:2TM domain-containing protein [Acidimicrobiia bacterium]MDH4307762.1 2TM domain-containing protein [Acidimicrobiia bacterium]
MDVDLSDFSDRRFNQDEVGEFIEAAKRLDQDRGGADGLTVDDLRRVALELRVSDEAILEVVQARMLDESGAVDRETTGSNRPAQLMERRASLTTYFATIAGLAAFDWFADQSIDCVWWPAAGWGVAVGIQTLNVLFRVEDQT